MFIRSKVSQLPRRRSHALKYLTMFFLWASAVMLAVQAFEITTNLNNAVQYIAKIVLTNSGWVTGTWIILDGSDGNAYFSGQIDVNGTWSFAIVCINGDCKSIWPSGDSVWSSGTSKIWYNDGNVGIGTTVPWEKFEVMGNIGLNNSLIFKGIGTGYIYPTNPAEDNGYDLTMRAWNADDLGFGDPYRGWDLFLKAGNGDGNSWEAFRWWYVYIEWGVGSDTYFGWNVHIDWWSWWTAGNIILSSLRGKVGIGTSNPWQALEVSGHIRLTTSWYIQAGTTYPNQLYLDSNSGYVGIRTNTPSTTLEVNGDITATAYYYSSDERFKTNLTSIDSALEKILALNGYFFTRKKTWKKDMWVIAQEVEKIFPEVVNTNADWYKSVEYGNLVAPLIEAIKELDDKVNEQQREIVELKSVCNF